MVKESEKDPNLTKTNEKEGRSEPRKRKKAMYKAIRDQMDFYLGDANMSKSTFLTQKILESDSTQEAAWLDLKLFLTFHKLASMLREFFGRADTTDDLWKALKSMTSETFEVRENDESSVRQIRRIKPLPEQPNIESVEARTIYVELNYVDPSTITNDMIRHVFSKYGNVSYVSMPKFKHNGLPKGFAFIEFSDENGAKNSMIAFVKAKRKIPSALDPSELQSIKSYNIEQEALEKSETKSQKQSISQPSPPKKCKVKEEEDEATEPQKKKRKRKHNEDDSEQQDPLTMFQMMPKSEWKRLRNKYLELQRKNVAHSKMKLRQYYEKAGEQQATEEITKPSKLDFTPGIIVKIVQADPIDDEKKVKQRIRAAVMESVGYVDATIGQHIYYVRCADEKQAKTLKNAKILGDGEILSGEAEKEYWSKIMEDRQAKLSGKVEKNKKPRGVKRIVKKYREMQHKENVHKYFEEEEVE